MGKAGRASKGTVNIESVEGRLRLRFRVDKKQYTLGLGLADTPVKRKFARIRANKIELDILEGNFDLTLEKYRVTTIPQQKTDTAPKQDPNTIQQRVATLFQSFINFKTPQLYSRSLEKYEATLKHLYHSGIGGKSALQLSEADAERFVAFLKRRCGALVIRERLTLLRACWEWAKINTNPWGLALGRVKVPPKMKPKPFTKKEVQAILEVFQTKYPHYLCYVTFLFSTGCRTAEVVGLRWGHISDNFATIWIGESLSKGVRKSTKTNKARVIPINERLQKLLVSIKPPRPNSDGLVFTSSRGCPIDEDNFCNRYWKPALRVAGVPYRKPYNCRHTFVSHCLEAGMSPTAVATITGHQVEVLYEHYAGAVATPSLPELYL